MLTRLAGAALLAGAGLLAGMEKRASHRAYLRALEDMDRALALAAGEIELLGRPLPELFMHLAEKGPEGTRSFFAGLKAEGEGPAHSWAEQCRKLFRGEQAAALASLSAVLGRYEADRQVREIEAVRRQLRDGSDMLRAQLEERTGNYPLLGLCAGAAAGIMLL